MLEEVGEVDEAGEMDVRGSRGSAFGHVGLVIWRFWETTIRRSVRVMSRWMMDKAMIVDLYETDLGLR